MSKLLIILINFFVAVGVAQAYTSPVGIPDPGPWGLYHPIDTAAPSTATQCPDWPSAATAGCYYIDNTHGSATDTDNTYGYPDKPRLTIPETTYDAGAYVYIHAGTYYWRSGDAEGDFAFSGTAESPCWLVNGTGVLLGQVKISGSYLYSDDLIINRDTTLGKDPYLKVGGDPVVADHMAFRGLYVQGDSNFHTGYGSAVYLVGSVSSEINNIVFYNVTVEDINSVTYARETESDDNHCILPSLYSSYVWVLDSTLRRCSGDGMQISGNNATGDARADHIYIGNNNISDNGENALDIKSSLDIIISNNNLFSHVDSMGSDGVAIVVQQEGGDGSDNVWIINNNFYSNRRAVRAEEAVTNTYVIGNVIHDANDEVGGDPTACNYPASQMYFRTDNVRAYIIDNTFDGYESGIAWDNDPHIYLHGNLFVNRNEPTGYDVCASTDDNVLYGTIDYNFFDTGDQFFVKIDASSYATLPAFVSGESECAHCVADTSGITAAHVLLSDSPAVDVSVEHAAYATFESRYGLDIRSDFGGDTRPSGGGWDIGGDEYQAGVTRKRTRIGSKDIRIGGKSVEITQ